MVSLDDVYRKFGEASEAAQLLETELGTVLLAIDVTDAGLVREHTQGGMDPRPTGVEPIDAPLRAQPPASREALEVLWSARSPLTTRQVHDAVARRYYPPSRSGSSMPAGWDEGLRRFAR